MPLAEIVAEETAAHARYEAHLRREKCREQVLQAARELYHYFAADPVMDRGGTTDKQSEEPYWRMLGLMCAPQQPRGRMGMTRLAGSLEETPHETRTKAVR